MSQLILAVLVFAGPHQHSLLSSAKPHDAATCYPLAGGCLFPLAMGSSGYVEVVSGWCQGHPGQQGAKQMIALNFQIWKFGRFEIQRPSHLLYF